MRYLSATSGSSQDFPVLSEGTHAARCYAVVDLGTQKTSYQGETKYERQIRVIWEVPGERMSDGRPMAISKTYKGSLNEKARFRKDIEAWRNKRMTDGEIKTFHPRLLLGRVAMISVIHTNKGDRTYANVNAVTPMLKGLEVSEQENPSLILDLDEFDPVVFEKLPKYLKAKIEQSPEYLEIASGVGDKTGQPDPDDEIPF